jgi:hypothetical protein
MVIGLYGKWGTWKAFVIKMAISELENATRTIIAFMPQILKNSRIVA